MSTFSIEGWTWKRVQSGYKPSPGEVWLNHSGLPSATSGELEFAQSQDDESYFDNMIVLSPPVGFENAPKGTGQETLV